MEYSLTQFEPTLLFYFTFLVAVSSQLPHSKKQDSKLIYIFENIKIIKTQFDIQIVKI